MNNIKDSDFISTFPPSLQKNETFFALGKLIAEELHITAREAEKNIIYANIDGLSEIWLDTLAYDLHVDWYNYDYPVEIKKELIKTSVMVHKKLGTVYAVETALKALYQNTKVEEWFEYEGEPFYFRIRLDITDSDIHIKKEELIKVINTYKRLTAHLDKIYYFYGSAFVPKIEYNSMLMFKNNFFPRFNLSPLMYSGTVKYNGKYRYNGILTGEKIFLYSEKLHIKIFEKNDILINEKLGIHSLVKYHNTLNSGFGLKNNFVNLTKFDNAINISTNYINHVKYNVYIKIAYHINKYNGATKYNGMRKYDAQIINEYI